MAEDKPRMEGKTVLVTGATHGIGKVTALELARMGATVVVHGRNWEHCEATVSMIKSETGNQNVGYLLADFSRLDDVRKLAADYKAKYRRLDVLINNAGGVYMDRKETADGYEMTLQVNYLSHFLLTNMLLNVIRSSAPSRIINVSSRAHERGRIRFDDLMGGAGFSGWAAYSQSKLANILFTYELARRLEASKVTCNALHPGFVASNFGMNNRMMRILRPFIGLVAISKEDGARTSIYLASSPEVEGVTGNYFINQRQTPSSKASYNLGNAAKLWQVSLELTGLKEKTTG